MTKADTWLTLVVVGIKSVQYLSDGLCAQQARGSFGSEEAQEDQEEEEEDEPPVPMTTRLRKQAERVRERAQEREQEREEEREQEREEEREEEEGGEEEEQTMTETITVSDGEEDDSCPSQWNVEQVFSYINSLPGTVSCPSVGLFLTIKFFFWVGSRLLCFLFSFHELLCCF